MYQTVRLIPASLRCTAFAATLIRKVLILCDGSQRTCVAGKISSTKWNSVYGRPTRQICVHVGAVGCWPVGKRLNLERTNDYWVAINYPQLGFSFRCFFFIVEKPATCINLYKLYKKHYSRTNSWSSHSYRVLSDFISIANITGRSSPIASATRKCTTLAKSSDSTYDEDSIVNNSGKSRQRARI